jgi:hypothetical protein
VKDEATQNLSERAKLALESLGSGLIRNLGYRGSFAFVGRKGGKINIILSILTTLKQVPESAMKFYRTIPQ